ncbi:hypothetical protein CR105_16080 [Massilia eurypsychrophila]|uniref:Uncharacterized protein n=1 Tax=Massilia eurypsychrophila TaxID=1485217 RepID=A0A2G8TD24_9BURK|nr:hypothetical protein [Massilia eurypsychrophila]PIL43869.1 hypothetical protein CR105_16080 [Massilia eurypsychrophila]
MSAAVLTRLDGYMAASGFGTDHPWRSEITSALAAPGATLVSRGRDIDAADDIDTYTRVTRSSMRTVGEQAGRDSLANLEGCVDPATAFEGWRAHCLAELVDEHKEHPDFAGLVTAWELGFDSVQPLGLTTKEMKLLKAYRLSDGRGRESIRSDAQSQAEDWPRYTFEVPLPKVGGGE